MAEVTQKPCAAEVLVGTEIEVKYGRNPKKPRHIKGTIEAWRYTGATIENFSAPADSSEALCYDAFELKIKPEDGGRAVWVGPFKDANNPRPSEIWT